MNNVSDDQDTARQSVHFPWFSTIANALIRGHNIVASQRYWCAKGRPRRTNEPSGMNVVWANCVFTINHNITSPPPPPLFDNWFVSDLTDTDYNLPPMDTIALKAAISCVFPKDTDPNLNRHFYVGESFSALACLFDSTLTGALPPYWIDRPYVFGNTEKTVFDNTGDPDEDFLMVNATLSLDLRATGRWVPGRLYDYRGARLNPTTGVYAAGVTDGAPMHPAGLAVASISGTNVGLNWTANAPSGLAAYVIYRSTTSGGPYTQVGTVTGSPPTNSHTNTVPSTGVTYYYVITAKNSTYESGFSDEISAAV